MNISIKCILYCLIIIVGLQGCTKSLIYSPTVNPPPRPLKQGESQFMAGVGYFPETRPDEVPHKTAFGGEAALRFAVCNHVTLQFKGWEDLSNNLEENRLGLSFAIISTLNDSSHLRFSLIPTGAFLFGDGEFEGGGGGLFLSCIKSLNKSFNLYACLGPAIGLRNAAEDEKQWGWGIILNAGTAVTIDKNFTLNVELAGVKQRNEYENKEDYFLCPMINIGYIMTPRKK